MNKRAVINVVAALVAVTGLMILLSGFVGFLMNDDKNSVMQMFESAAFSIVLGTVFFLLTRAKNKKFRLGIREGFGIVTLGWIAASAFGAIPYIIISKMFWYDAFFETMSGFTTTGASVLDSNLLLMNGKPSFPVSLICLTDSFFGEA
jgi:trk system potassium uptake protein TrkH